MRRLLAAALAAALCGCLGYRLGPGTGVEAGSSLEILPFPNRTVQPGLSPALASALRRQLQSEGIFRLQTRGRADYRLQGSIVGYRRIGLAFEAGDALTPRDLELRMEAEVRLEDLRDGRILLEETLSGRTLVRAFQDLSQSEQRALPLLCRDLALKIADRIQDGSWQGTAHPLESPGP